MSLNYDFDIVTTVPDDLESGQAEGVRSEDIRVRAAFRDVKTADALREASPEIREIFIDAGFDLSARGGTSPSGYYPSGDADDRARILRRLFANIRRIGLEGAYFGDFDFQKFLEHLKTAQPEVEIVRQETPARTAQPAPSPGKPERRTVQGRIGFALGLAVLLFVLLKYLAAAGASP